MSGIALICQRDSGEPVRRPDFEPVVDALGHRGPDGRRIVWQRGAALAHQHFWTTPEEVGEEQPLSVDGDRYQVALDGRLDNRQELLEALGQPSTDASPLTDAQLIASAYGRWGEGCFRRLLGPFAVALFDSRRHRVVCGRDALGDRTLFHFFDGKTFLAGTEEQALLRHPRVSADLDEETLARFFALWGPLPGATFFTDLRELPPGHYLTLEDGRLEVHEYWEADPRERLRYATDDEYAQHFRQLLTDSVRCRLRSPDPPSVLMSGGLDSTSVAAAAANEMSHRNGKRLRVISWVFDDLVEHDERRYMDPMIERFGLEATRLPGDGAWPLRDLETWQVNPNAPVRDLYRLRETAYGASRQEGCRVMLTGDFGDHLHTGFDFWLRDLLAEGRLMDVARGIQHLLLADSMPAARKLKRLRQATTRALGWRGRSPRPPEWLTATARGQLGDVEPLPRAAEARRPEQYRVLLDPFNAHSVNLEQHFAHRQGIELRFPFRDRRLVQFVLSIPAHQVYRPGWFKWVLRQATRGVLPDAVRSRRDPTSLLALCARGLVEREAESVTKILASPDAIWPRYVQPGWLRKGFPSHLRARRLTLETVVAWRCICVELWRQRAGGKRPQTDQTGGLCAV